MLPRDSDRSWEQLGREDPYFGVISTPDYRRGSLDEDTLRDFFQSGEDHVARVVAAAGRLHGDFAPTRCLDFGCGVGRVAIPLARRFGAVVGVDVSAAMLDEADANARRSGVENLTLVRSDDGLSQVVGPFDFVHSYIVLQHIPVNRGMRIVERLVDLLAPGGVGAIQVTYHCAQPRLARITRTIRERVPFAHGAANLVRRRDLHDPYMLMQGYDLNAVLHVLQRHGCTELLTEFTDHGGIYGVMLYFRTPSAG